MCVRPRVEDLMNYNRLGANNLSSEEQSQKTDEHNSNSIYTSTHNTRRIPFGCEFSV